MVLAVYIGELEREFTRLAIDDTHPIHLSGAERDIASGVDVDRVDMGPLPAPAAGVDGILLGIEEFPDADPANFVACRVDLDEIVTQQLR